ncbi:hypothetical protein MRX96_021547 [Rhipicephalus microplus]
MQATYFTCHERGLLLALRTSSVCSGERKHRRSSASSRNCADCSTVGTRPGSQRGEPTASPHGRNHRDVATWTSQDGGDPPVSYVSSRPWRRQERARVGVAPAHLYRPFQGRTVEDADRRANGACLPVPAGTRFCECGAVVIHNSHELGKLHRHRTQATQPSSRESSQERSGAAVRAMLARAAQEADFAQWLLRVASGHASSESPPAPLSITATVERGAAGPGETLVAAALTPELYFWPQSLDKHSVEQAYSGFPEHEPLFIEHWLKAKKAMRSLLGTDAGELLERIPTNRLGRPRRVRLLGQGGGRVYGHAARASLLAWLPASHQLRRPRHNVRERPCPGL